MFIDTPSNTIKRIGQKVPAHLKAAFTSAFLVGLLTHGYMMANKLPNHDELIMMIYDNDVWGSGRWFLRFPSAISGMYSLPVVNGVLALLYIAVAACLLLASLKITDTLASVLVAVLMVSFPPVTATFTYMYTVDAYSFALLLACLAVFLAERYKYGFLFAILPLTLSLGCYQAYFGVAAGLMVMILLFATLDSQTELRQTIIKGGKYVGTLVASLLLYMGIARLVIWAKGGELDTYQGIDQMGRLALADLPRLVGEAYAGVFRYYFTAGSLGEQYQNIHHKLAVLLFVAAFAAGGFLLVLWGGRAKIHRDGKRLLLLLALLLLFPLGCNIVFVMTPQLRHLLMYYGLVLVLVFPVAVAARHPIAEEIKRKLATPTRVYAIACWIIAATLAFSIYNYAVLANKAYLKMTLGYEQAYAQSVSLVTRIESLPGYSHDKEIVLVGLPYRDMDAQRTVLADFDSFEIIGVHGGRLFGEIYTYHAFLNNYLGWRNPVHLSREENIKEADVAALLREMPQYPDEGAIAIINDRIYVKFSYNPDNPVGELYY
ncbi:MAG: glucosyltransferase domain-containing protein [Lachnospiraceae bacterium]|jgi:hypothetical protein|nr:glucosyltransferase domain-containing protein [Lachnospiraceae bacterium]